MGKRQAQLSFQPLRLTGRYLIDLNEDCGLAARAAPANAAADASSGKYNSTA